MNNTGGASMQKRMVKDGIVVRRSSGFLIMASIALFSGCTTTVRVTEEQKTPRLSYKPTTPCLIGVQDKRPYVETREKPPRYAGRYWGPFGIPGDILIENDASLADRLTATIVTAFRKSSGEATGVSVPSTTPTDQISLSTGARVQGAELLLVLKEWRLERITNTARLEYSVDASVQNTQGQSVFTTSFKGQDEVNGIKKYGFSLAGFNQLLDVANRESLEKILNDPGIASALQGAPAPVPKISPQAPTVKPSQYPASDKAEKLRELKKLKDEGILTESEYEQKRKAIVDSL